MAKKPKIPEFPKRETVPEFQSGYKSLSSLGQRLTSFDLTGRLSPLQDVISFDPEVTKLALEFAEKSLTPAYQRQIKEIRNEAARAGALTSSTFTNALTNAMEDLQTKLQAATIGAALEDKNRALQGRLSLLGTGLGALESGTAFAQNEQQMLQQYNRDKYEAALGEAMLKRQGGLIGGLTGAIGGGMTGFAMSGGNPYAAALGATLGGVSGAMGSPGTGGQWLSTGSTLYGGLGGQSRPGMTAGAGKQFESIQYPYRGRLYRNARIYNTDIWGGL